VERLTPEARERVVVQTPVDLSGIFAELSSFSVRTTAVDPLIEGALAAATLDQLPPCQVVLSAGVLSQILVAVLHALGQQHEACQDLLVAARIGHLALMLEMLAPGGRAIITGEIVSSDTFPELALAPTDKLASLADQLIGAGNFFSGMNPARIVADFTENERLAEAKGVLIEGPWLWSFSKRRTYLAYAVRFEKYAPVNLGRWLSHFFGSRAG
jgi:hypothetical protein